MSHCTEASVPVKVLQPDRDLIDSDGAWSETMQLNDDTLGVLIRPDQNNFQSHFV